MLIYKPEKNNICSEKLYHVIVPEIATLTETDLQFYHITHGPNREHIKKHVMLSIPAMVKIYNDGHSIYAISTEEAVRIFNDIQERLHSKYSPNAGPNSPKGTYDSEVEAMDRFSREIYNNNPRSINQSLEAQRNINPFDPLQDLPPEIPEFETESMEMVSPYDIKRRYMEQNSNNEPPEYVSILDRFWGYTNEKIRRTDT